MLLASAYINSDEILIALHRFGFYCKILLPIIVTSEQENPNAFHYLLILHFVQLLFCVVFKTDAGGKTVKLHAGSQWIFRLSDHKNPIKID